MKIEKQEADFKPVSITFETKAELDFLKCCFQYYNAAGARGMDPEFINMNEKIRKS